MRIRIEMASLDPDLDESKESSPDQDPEQSKLRSKIFSLYIFVLRNLDPDPYWR